MTFKLDAAKLEEALTAAVDRCIRIDDNQERNYAIRGAAVEEGYKLAMSELLPVIDGLRDVAARQIAHANNGLCPDEVEGFVTRDDECPACQALMAADQVLALANSAGATPSRSRDEDSGHAN